MAAVEAPAPDPPRSLGGRLRNPTWAGALGCFVVLGGWVIGLRPLADNSFLTHLATGRIILDSGSVPTADPYTFSAPGEPWVVQSWLASLALASVERLAGLDGVRVLVGALVATLTGLGWTMLRPADRVVTRLAAAGLFIGVGASLWAERPLLVGLICLALVVLAAEGRLDPRVLLPLAWIWVNAHGSFPLGVVYLVVAGVGRRLDGQPTTPERRALTWLVPGILLGAVGPLGLKVLWFPFELLQQQDVLRGVVEWRAPTFDTTSQRLFVVQLALAILLVARRPSYRSALVLAVFGATALLGLRNVSVASLVILPGMASGLAGLGSLEGADRPRVGRAVVSVAAATFVALSAVRAGQVDLRLNKYPVVALAHLEGNGVDTRRVRLAGPDFVGNLIDYVYGPERRTFYDDRFDMFPREVSVVQQALDLGTDRMRLGLDEYEVALVVLPKHGPSAQMLMLDPDWRVLFIDSDWMLACRRGIELGGSLRSC